MGYEQLHEGVADYDTSFALINRGYEPDQHKAGQWFETTEDVYNYFLNVLPPLYFDGSNFMMCEASTNTLSEMFMQINGRFFCLTAPHGGTPTIPDSIRTFYKHMKEGALA